MAPLALTLACAALVAAALPAPGLYVAIALGIVAVGSGWLGYSERSAPGARRLMGAAAITVGTLGALLGSARVVMTVVAIDRIERMLG
jgi:hypothetical protein